MKFSAKNIAFAIALVALAGIGIYFITGRKPAAPTKSIDVTDPLASAVVPEKYRSDTATAQVMQKEIDQVRKIYREKPNDWETWIAIGNLKANTMEDYAGAIEAYQKSLAITPSNVLGYRNIAEVYNQHLHDYDKAATYYRLAIKNNLLNPEMYIALAQVQYYRFNQPAEAEKTLLDGLKQTGNNSDIRVRLIYLYRDTKNTAKYKLSARELIKAYPNNTLYRQSFADALR